MAKTWVLHTETKGTGAHMVPLDSAEKRPSLAEPIFVPRKPAPPREPEAPKPKAPHRFRIVDVMTRQELVDDGSVREAVAALKSVRSVVDVEVYVWQEESRRWRALSFAERRSLLELARR